MTVRQYQESDLPAMMQIWNQVVTEGNAFPQRECLNAAEAAQFFGSQSFCGVAETDGEIVGLYILHPNNVGRCGHIANASYAVAQKERGKHIGEQLVRHCLTQAGAMGFRILQFNAVVDSNLGAIALYERLGFVRLGTVPGGFLNGENQYEDILLFYHTL